MMFWEKFDIFLGVLCLFLSFSFDIKVLLIIESLGRGVCSKGFCFIVVFFWEIFILDYFWRISWGK